MEEEEVTATGVVVRTEVTAPSSVDLPGFGAQDRGKGLTVPFPGGVKVVSGRNPVTSVVPILFLCL